jgi:hypothetical protein
MEGKNDIVIGGSELSHVKKTGETKHIVKCLLAIVGGVICFNLGGFAERGV